MKSVSLLSAQSFFTRALSLTRMDRSLDLSACSDADTDDTA
jgi:hypothetical protein